MEPGIYQESAAQLIAEVSDYSPLMIWSLKTKIAYGVALRDAGHKEEALELFDNMSSEDKYKDAFDQYKL